jgi:hypothetical protein
MSDGTDPRQYKTVIADDPADPDGGTSYHALDSLDRSIAETQAFGTYTRYMMAVERACVDLGIPMGTTTFDADFSARDESKVSAIGHHLRGAGGTRGDRETAIRLLGLLGAHGRLETCIRGEAKYPYAVTEGTDYNKVTVRIFHEIPRVSLAKE